jgi:hypothetical protein
MERAYARLDIRESAWRPARPEIEPGDADRIAPSRDTRALMRGVAVGQASLLG